MDFLQLEMVSPSVCIPRGCDSGVVAGHDIGAAGQLHSVHLVPREAWLELSLVSLKQVLVFIGGFWPGPGGIKHGL